MKKPILFIITLLLGFVNYSMAQCLSGASTNPTSTCSDRVFDFIVMGANDATSYTWEITGASSFNVNLTNSKSYSIRAGSGDITVKVTSVGGTCNGQFITSTITVAAAPPKPTITQTGDLLTATVGGSSYQWYLNNQPISGATTRTFTMVQSGSYTVEFKNAGGCSNFSDVQLYYTTAIKEDAKFKSFSFYPNPVVISSNKMINTDFNLKYNLEFYDATGKKVAENLNLNGKEQTDMSNLSKGIHIMKVSSDGKMAVRKIIIQ